MNPDPVLAARDAFLYLGALGLFACIAVLLHYSRRVAQAEARSIHPAARTAPPCHSCHQAPRVVTRILASNYTAIRVCDKCDHEGELVGRWIDMSEVAS